MYRADFEFQLKPLKADKVVQYRTCEQMLASSAAISHALLLQPTITTFFPS